MTSSITLEMIKELSVWIFVGAITASLWVVPLINFLYKLQFVVKHQIMPSKVNEEWMKIHGKDTGTPTNGGILIWITTSVLLLLFFWHIPFFKVLGLIIFLVGLYGFAEKLLDISTRKNLSFREFQETFGWRLGKLAVVLGIHFVVAYLLVYVAGITMVSIFGMTIALTTWYGFPLVAIASMLFSYSTEITDGIDALSSGLYLITFIGLAFIMLAFPALYLVAPSVSTMTVVGLFIGVLLVYLYFNIPPARVYMGESGAMLFGPVFLALLLYGNMLPAALIFIAPYALDLASTIIQIIAIRFFKRRVFKIAPVHHHFEAIGWSGPKVVMRWWLFNWLFVFLAVIVQVFLNS